MRTQGSRLMCGRQIPGYQSLRSLCFQGTFQPDGRKPCLQLPVRHHPKESAAKNHQMTGRMTAAHQCERWLVGAWHGVLFEYRGSGGTLGSSATPGCSSGCRSGHTAGKKRSTRRNAWEDRRSSYSPCPREVESGASVSMVEPRHLAPPLFSLCHPQLLGRSTGTVPCE